MIMLSLFRWEERLREGFFSY
ncbi:hypothetical protein CHELA20_11362 [Hyphomicrobiales bacterium]|nr:hypothetical protein CHELA20_11362 [Hyphomicrobiales bacterium]CAH1695713.1 hypothetical protein CHELA41_51610 [Hyphomicrobiales bacterium]